MVYTRVEGCGRDPGRPDWGGDPVPKVMVQTWPEKVWFSPLDSREVCLVVQTRAGLQPLPRGQRPSGVQNVADEQLVV